MSWYSKWLNPIFTISSYFCTFFDTQQGCEIPTHDMDFSIDVMSNIEEDVEDFSTIYEELELDAWIIKYRERTMSMMCPVAPLPSTSSLI